MTPCPNCERRAEYAMYSYQAYTWLRKARKWISKYWKNGGKYFFSISFSAIQAAWMVSILSLGAKRYAANTTKARNQKMPQLRTGHSSNRDNLPQSGLPDAILGRQSVNLRESDALEQRIEQTVRHESDAYYASKKEVDI